jgi:hypothetical protein
VAAVGDGTAFRRGRGLVLKQHSIGGRPKLLGISKRGNVSGALLMSMLFGLFPFLLEFYADSGYRGPKFLQELRRVCRQINLEIVKRSDAGKFVVLPKRWIVEQMIPDGL